MDWRYPNVGCLFHIEPGSSKQNRDYASNESPPHSTMDWRYPNVGCLFHIEPGSSKQNRDYARYARSIKNPFKHGLGTQDYDADHKPRMWPSGTEYQDAYCSNYQAQKTLQCEEDLYQGLRDNFSSPFPGGAETEVPELCQAPLSHDNYKLSKVMPLPVLDKHYRGARYSINDPVGVLVPEELSSLRDTLNGPVRLSNHQHQKNSFLPNTRYHDWVSRPMIDIHKEMESDELFCRLPEAPTKYWDFYNVVRMRRPAKPSKAVPEFQQCFIVPIPMDKNIPDLPTASENPYFGKFNHYQCSNQTCGHRNATAALHGQC